MPSIWTLTLNPSLDVSMDVEQVRPDRKLRCSAPRRDPGGGGINVARAIHRLGGEAGAMWLCGGPTGAMLGERLDGEGIRHVPIQIAAVTRESVVVSETASDHQFRFVPPGAEVTGEERDRVLRAVRTLDPRPDYLVLSGSLPEGVGDDFWARVIEAAPGEVRIVLDTSGKPLGEALAAGVYLAKPNFRELTDLAGRDLENDAEIADFARGLIGDGRAQVVVVSLGRGGSLLVTADRTDHVRTPTVPICSKVGAGDSMVGGMTLSLSRGRTPGQAVRFGSAAGAAAVMTPGTELCRREDAERLYREMRGEERG